MENLKKLYRIVRPLKWVMILLSFITVFETGLNIITPWVYKMIINNAADVMGGKISLQEAQENMYMIILYLVVILFISNVLNILNNLNSVKIQVKSEQFIRERLFEHLAKLPIEFFEREKIGKIINKMNRGIQRGGYFINNLSNWVLAQIITGIVAIIVIFILDIAAGIIALLGSIIFIYSTQIMIKKIIPIIKKANKKHDIIGSHIFDTFSGMYTVRSFNKEREEIDLFKSRNKEFIDLQLKKSKTRQKYFFGRYSVIDITRIIVIVIAGFRAMRGEISAGDIMLYASYMNYIVWPLNQITYFYDESQEAMRSVDDIIKILEIEPNIQDKDDAKVLKNVKGKIEFKKVSFSYGKGKKVLKEVNLSIKPGESVALVGPSGTGKTTITKLIMRFYDVSSGKVMIDGNDVRDVTQKSLRDNIGVVMQDIMLFNDTIKNNIKYGVPRAKNDDIVNAAKAANIHDFIMGLPKQYNTLVGERGVKLSGGEKQRVAIARAVLKNAPILILDEATSHLDSESERLVQEALWRLIKGRTTIIIAHRLATVMRADKILVLDRGRIVEEGNHRELIAKNGLYAKLFKLQSGAMLLTNKEESIAETEIHR